jgi:hypothetical protein
VGRPSKKVDDSTRIEKWALQCVWARGPPRSNSDPIRTDDGTGKVRKSRTGTRNRGRRFQRLWSRAAGGSEMGKRRQLICIAAAVAAAAILLTGNEVSNLDRLV